MLPIWLLAISSITILIWAYFYPNQINENYLDINLNNKEAKQKALHLGAKILSSISIKTDYLIYGEKPGSKIFKAKEMKIKILSEKEWISIIH